MSLKQRLLADANRGPFVMVPRTFKNDGRSTLVVTGAGQCAVLRPGEVVVVDVWPHFGPRVDEVVEA